MKRQIVLHILATLIFTFPINLYALEKGNNKSRNYSTKEVLINPSASLIDINNITSWVNDDGFHDWVIASTWNGAFPKGNDVGALFTEGIIWGGQVLDGQSPLIRVNGNDYSSGTYPLIRLFRVRPDFASADLTNDAANFNIEDIGQVTQSQIIDLRSQYQSDWNEWPANLGAPYQDVNKDGQYDPSIDIPGVPGAAQTLFIMYNDDNSNYLYSSAPIGLQIQETYWAYNQVPALKDVIYKKVDVVYNGTYFSLSNSRVDSLYIVQFVDPDVGNPYDDFVGCDTSLNLGYAYNSSPSDNIYSPIDLAPPAIGFDFLQGVSQYTGNQSDSAVFNLEWRKGYKYSNLKPLSSFVYFAANGQWTDPKYNYSGTLQYYNLMRGYLPDSVYPSEKEFPSSVVDYTKNGCFLLSGDPLTGAGKVDGVVDSAGDRRMMLINGPFNISLGDTIEIVVALVAGIGNTNLESISELRKNSISADSAYFAMMKPVSIVGISSQFSNNIKNNSYNLRQNYPNPFNPTTTISYDLPKRSNVVIKIYNIIGEEVANLINTEQNAGKYSINWNAKGLASGVYIYRLQANDLESNSCKNFSDTKKLILMK